MLCTDKHNAWIIHRTGQRLFFVPSLMSLFPVAARMVAGNQRPTIKKIIKRRKESNEYFTTSVSKAEIMWQLHEIIDYHLFESTSWPADIDAVRAFFRMLEEMGLEEAVPGTK